jgi:hypothetical protein
MIWLFAIQACLWWQPLQVFVSDPTVLHQCVQHFDGRNKTSVLYVVGNQTIFAISGKLDERFSCSTDFVRSAPTVPPYLL